MMFTRFERQGTLRLEGIIVRQIGGMHRYGHQLLSVVPVQSSFLFVCEVSGTANPIGAQKDQKHEHPKEDADEHDNAD